MEPSFESFITNQSPKNLNYKHLSITEKSRYSSLMPWHFDQVRSIFLQETKGLNIKHIVDANAHIGVDAILFRIVYPNANITAIELDNNTFVQLEKNISKLPLITGNANVRTIVPVHMDCLDYIFDQKILINYPYDLIYFDPPWNDADYKSKNLEDLYLSEESLSDIVNNVLENLPCLICIKLPVNINLTLYRKKINAEYFRSYNIYTTPKKVKVSYVLVFIQ